MIMIFVLVFITDIDECSLELCGTHASGCINTVFSYECRCENGFEHNSDSYNSSCEGESSFKNSDNDNENS